eukprot:Nitzschia sp. Nitz4//scaffold358_size24170//3784//11028//NITZ4_008429-RA/size24170-augustus-gene-0.44-mRNA-1//1//CDS//3329548996//6149//frame0
MHWIFSILSVAPLLPLATAVSEKSDLQTIRRAAIGDFDELNVLFENAKVVVPDTFVVSEKVGIATLNMNISNLVCFDMSIGDVIVSHERESNQAVNVDIDVQALDLTCEMDYVYRYGLLRGDGNVVITTDDNRATSTLRFISNDFSTQPPTGSSIQDCATDVEIQNMEFSGDFVSEIIEFFQAFVRGVVEREIGDVACRELGSIGTTFLGTLLDLADSKLDPYSGSVGEEYTDPLYVEKHLVLPSDLVALDFIEPDNAVSKMFAQVLDALELYLATSVSDGSSGTELVVNKMIRDYILDDERAFTIQASQLPLETTEIFTAHDNLFETTMSLNSMKIYGLDNMTRFNPFNEIGSHTLQNELTWSDLSVAFDLTVDMKPSSLEDAILQDPTSNGITEQITIAVGVDNLDLTASLLVVIDEDKLGSIELGSLMETTDIVPCLFSVLHQVELVGLIVDPNLIDEHALSDFISPGLDKLFTDSAAAAITLYTGVLRESLTNIFQVSVRNFANDFIIDQYLTDYTDLVCPSAPSSSGYINFQDFFSGDGSFGDVPAMLKDLLDTELLATKDGSDDLKINDALLIPLTERQSGVAGTFQFEDYLFNVTSDAFAKFGLESIQLGAFGLQFDHVDSLVSPATLLEPKESDPMVLTNMINVASGDSSLQVSLGGLFATSGDSVLSMRNELNMALNLSGFKAVADVLTKMGANEFLQFPLRDLVNMDCWLSTLELPTLLEDNDAGISLRDLLMTIPSMDMSVSCSNCTSVGLDVLPGILDTLNSGGVTDVMEQELLNVALEIVTSEFVQAYLNKMVLDGSLRCPHSSQFVSSTADSNYPIPTYPTLGYDALESLVFVSTVFMHTALTVAAESHKYYDLELTDPLSAQVQLGDTSDVSLVDFSKLETSFGDWAGKALDEFLAYLNELVVDDEGATSLRINRLLQSGLLDDSGALTLEFDGLAFGGNDTSVSFESVQVTGLDTVELLEAMDAIGPQTIRNKLKLQNLSLVATFSIVGADGSTTTAQQFTLSFELEEVDVSLALFLAVDLDILGAVQLGSVLDLKNVIPCVLSAARHAEVTEFEVSVASLHSLVVKGFRSEELVENSKMASQLFMDQYGEMIVSSLPGFFDHTVRTMVNNWMLHMMGDWSSIACPVLQFELASINTVVDFRDLLLSPTRALELGATGLSQYGDMFRKAYQLLQDVVFKTDEATGLSAFNDVIVAPLTTQASNDSGTFMFPGELGSATQIHVGALNTTLELRASNARLTHLDSVGSPLELLQATSHASTLDNTGTLGVGSEPLHFGVRLLVALDGEDDVAVRNEMELSMDFTSLTLLLSTMMQVSESRFYDFPLKDVLNLNCWLATIPAPELDAQGLRVRGVNATANLASVVASVASVEMNITCVDCSSPRMEEFARLVSSSSNTDEITDVVNELLNYFGGLAGGEFVQVQIDRFLNDAAMKCPHSPQYDEDFVSTVYEPLEAVETNYTVSYLILLGSVTLALIMVVALVVLTVRYIVRRRHKKWLGNLPPHKVRALARRQGKEQQFEGMLSASTRSMFTSKDIPRFVRWFMPVVLVGNIAFFLSGHLSLGATVNVEADVAGERLVVEKFFEFSVARSTIDIWNAGGHELTILVALFSGVWPYTKQLITLFLWFASPSQVSVSRRGSILVWLDWLAKWSMVDIFVLVISIAAFRVSVQSPSVAFLPDDFYAVDMMVVPLWGLYANLIAQLISQVSSHFIIHYHRRIAREGQLRVYQQLTGGEPSVYLHGDPKHEGVFADASIRSGDSVEETVQRQALRHHQFGRPHRGETEKLVVRSGVNCMLWVAALALITTVVIGCSIPSLSLEMFGIVGVAVEFGQDFQEAHSKHSVFSILQLLMEEARFIDSFPSYLGLFSLCTVLFVTVFVVPMLQSIALLVQWFFPATNATRARRATFIEALQAWQYAEVYLLAVFVSSWQLGPVSQYMINAYCGNLEEMFAQAVYYGVLSEEDAQCFSVQSSIEKGSFWLAGGAVVLALVNSFVSKAVTQFFRDQESHAIGNFSDGESDGGFTAASGEDQFTADAGFSARIRPAPVMFTDTFRWLLRRDSSLPASSRAIFADDIPQWGDIPEAKAIAYDDDDDFHQDMAQARYVYSPEKPGSHSKGSPKSHGGSNKQLPMAAAAKGRRLFEDDVSTIRSVSTDSTSVTRGGRTMTTVHTNLKDDMTYATPPGATPRMRSQPPPSVSQSEVVTPRTTTQSMTTTQRPTAAPVRSDSSNAPTMMQPSLGLSTTRSLSQVSNGSRSRQESIQPFQDELSAEERLAVESLLREDEQSAFETVESEYVEETVDDEFEEYTVKTMSEILEVTDDEDNTYSDTQSYRIV